MKINQSIKGLDFDPDWSILDIDSRISKVSFWYWVISWFPGYEMWPKSACDFLAPLLLSRNRRFAECILIPRKPNPCSIEFGNAPTSSPRHLLFPVSHFSRISNDEKSWAILWMQNNKPARWSLTLTNGRGEIFSESQLWDLECQEIRKSVHGLY